MKVNSTSTGTEMPTVPSPRRTGSSVLPPQPAVEPASESARLETFDNKPGDGLDEAPEPNIPPRRFGIRLLKFAALALVFGAAVYGGLRWRAYTKAWISTDNAYVSARIHTVSARVAGTVQEVVADENQEVRSGVILVRLDPHDFEAHRQQAQAQLAQAQAQVSQANAQIAQAAAQVSREKARATKSEQDLARAKSLFEGGAGAISRQEYEQAQAEAQAAAAAVEAAQATVTSAQATAKAGQALEQAARANLRDAELQLSYTEIAAPADGRVGKRNVETGNRVQPGQPLLALVEPEVWVTANFKETQLARLRPGQPVHVRLDAFPGRVFLGWVDSVSPASGAQFALLPPDNATGNFTKIVQRVPVKIVFDSRSLGPFNGRITPGMSAVAEVNVRD